MKHTKKKKQYKVSGDVFGLEELNEHTNLFKMRRQTTVKPLSVVKVLSLSYKDYAKIMNIPAKAHSEPAKYEQKPMQAEKIPDRRIVIEKNSTSHLSYHLKKPSFQGSFVTPEIMNVDEEDQSEDEDDSEEEKEGVSSLPFFGLKSINKKILSH